MSADVNHESYREVSPIQSDIEQQRLADLFITAWINAGGLGTRLRGAMAPHPELGITKSMLQFGDPPITLIEHHIHKLHKLGVTAIIAGIGHHHHVASLVQDVFGHHKHIYAHGTPKQHGTGGDLLKALRERPEVFHRLIYVTNVDTILDIHEPDLVDSHVSHKGALTIALTTRKGVPNEGAYIVDHHNHVLYCGETLPASNRMTREEALAISAYQGSSTGAMVIDRDFLRSLPWQEHHGPLSLYRDVVGHAMQKAGVYAFNNGERHFSDVGTAEAWEHLQANLDIYQPYIHYAA